MDENHIIKSVEHFNSSLVAKYMYDGMSQILNEFVFENHLI